MLIAGIDEAGRGALAGPVVVGLVIFDPITTNSSLFKDSKVLTHKKRNILYKHLRETNSQVIFSIINHKKIDTLNILQATLLGMKQCILKLKTKPDHIIIDGNKKPSLKNFHITTCVKGDQKIPEISAASIVAKVVRDTIMTKYHQYFPDYNFNEHKGYGTKDHFETIFKHGRSKIHRQTFAVNQQLSLNLS